MSSRAQRGWVVFGLLIVSLLACAAAVMYVRQPRTVDRLAEEDEIKEAVIRHVLKGETKPWCLDDSVGPGVYARISDLKVSRNAMDCRESTGLPGKGTYFRRMGFKRIAWQGPESTEVVTWSDTGGLVGLSKYGLRRRKAKWTVVEVLNPGLQM